MKKKAPSPQRVLDPKICTCCGKPLSTKVYDDLRMQELSDFYNEILEDHVHPGYFAHRICRQTILDTAFRSAGL